MNEKTARKAATLSAFIESENVDAIIVYAGVRNWCAIEIDLTVICSSSCLSFLFHIAH